MTVEASETDASSHVAIVKSPDSYDNVEQPRVWMPRAFAASEAASHKESEAKDTVPWAEELAKEQILRVRDFAFDDEDERHHGIGSVIPAPSQPMYVALYDFHAEAANELSVEAGTPVQIMSEIPGGWVLAQLVDDPSRCGLVPYTYLQAVGGE